jgi:hypothetical protein
VGGDQFGYSVALSGGAAVTGADRHTVGSSLGQGVVYVFESPSSQPATLTPAKAPYAKQRIGTSSAAKTFTLTNDQSVALTEIAISTTGDFAVSKTTCEKSLQPKGKCTIGVTFTPTAAGTLTGQLTINDSASNATQTSNLTGTGEIIPTLSSIAISPADATIAAESAIQLTAWGTYDDGSYKNITAQVTWTSSDTELVSIAAGGLATGVKPGTATITAGYEGLTGTGTVNVSGSDARFGR